MVDSLQQDDLPHCFCQTTYQLLRDPVLAEDNITYEREEIERWFRDRRQKGLPLTSLLHSGRIHSDRLRPNYALKGAIQDFDRFLRGERKKATETAENARLAEEAHRAAARLAEQANRANGFLQNSFALWK